MIMTGHLLVGGAIGAVATTILPPPWAVPFSFLAGIVSHHLLDLIPHTDAAPFWPDTRRIPWFAMLVITIEVLLGCSLTGTLFVAQHTSWAFAAGAVGGILPDVLDEVPAWKHHFRA